MFFKLFFICLCIFNITSFSASNNGLLINQTIHPTLFFLSNFFERARETSRKTIDSDTEFVNVSINFLQLLKTLRIADDIYAHYISLALFDSFSFFKKLKLLKDIGIKNILNLNAIAKQANKINQIIQEYIIVKDPNIAKLLLWDQALAERILSHFISVGINDIIENTEPESLIKLVIASYTFYRLMAMQLEHRKYFYDETMPFYNYVIQDNDFGHIFDYLKEKILIGLQANAFLFKKIDDLDFEILLKNLKNSWNDFSFSNMEEFIRMTAYGNQETRFANSLKALALLMQKLLSTNEAKKRLNKLCDRNMDLQNMVYLVCSIGPMHLLTLLYLFKKIKSDIEKYNILSLFDNNPMIFNKNETKLIIQKILKFEVNKLELVSLVDGLLALFSLLQNAKKNDPEDMIPTGIKKEMTYLFHEYFNLFNQEEPPKHLIDIFTSSVRSQNLFLQDLLPSINLGVLLTDLADELKKINWTVDFSVSSIKQLCEASRTDEIKITEESLRLSEVRLPEFINGFLAAFSLVNLASLPNLKEKKPIEIISQFNTPFYRYFDLEKKEYPYKFLIDTLITGIASQKKFLNNFFRGDELEAKQLIDNCTSQLRKYGNFPLMAIGVACQKFLLNKKKQVFTIKNMQIVKMNVALMNLKKMFS